MRPFSNKSLHGVAGITVALLIVSTSVRAQNTQGYTRKSISHTTTILSAGNFSLAATEERLFLSAINTGIQIPRFDYNPLPENIQASFKKMLSQDKHISESDLETVIGETIVPEILKILDFNKEIRAQNLVTETQRNSFIALKAKDSGITSQQLEQIMNSSYIYIPFINNYKTEKNSDKDEIKVSLSGGLLWYQVVPGENPRAEKLARLTSEAYSSAKTDESQRINGQPVSPREYAFWSAANTLAMNLEIKTRELDMFKLSAPIVEIQRRKIGFPLGCAEGIKLDDPFFVGEWLETETGKIKFKTSGFVRVSTVSDNRQSDGQLSRAVAIKKGDWSRGMMITEHPRLGVDIAMKPRWFEINVESGFMMNTEKGFVVYFDDYSGSAIGLDLNFQWNIASLVKKRQNFLVFGGTVSAIPVESTIIDFDFDDPDWSLLDLLPTHNWIAGLYYGYAGYLKRYYLGPFAIHGEASIGTQIVSTGKVRGVDYEGEKVTISNYTIGVRLNVGLEYAVNIDWNVGVFAGIQAFPPLDWWTVKYDDEEIDIDNVSWDPPKFYSYSPTFGIYIHFSPPTLPFNPAAIIQNQMKNLGN
ncbi:autotransporter outer membrane beta-barrel domain-containing protein [bacterium]|nr:autotransporter outer membrane beta-barrel domain-containing protein [bacterium]MBU1635836.1 autotransporter outer membrane beta-barrel domain-containing protein [bacterium]